MFATKTFLGLDAAQRPRPANDRRSYLVLSLFFFNTRRFPETSRKCSLVWSWRIVIVVGLKPYAYVHRSQVARARRYFTSIIPCTVRDVYVYILICISFLRLVKSTTRVIVTSSLFSRSIYRKRHSGRRRRVCAETENAYNNIGIECVCVCVV